MAVYKQITKIELVSRATSCNHCESSNLSEVVQKQGANVLFCQSCGKVIEQEKRIDLTPFAKPFQVKWE